MFTTNTIAEVERVDAVVAIAIGARIGANTSVALTESISAPSTIRNTFTSSMNADRAEPSSIQRDELLLDLDSARGSLLSPNVSAMIRISIPIRRPASASTSEQLRRGRARGG